MMGSTDILLAETICNKVGFAWAVSNVGDVVSQNTILPAGVGCTQFVIEQHVAECMAVGFNFNRKPQTTLENLSRNGLYFSLEWDVCLEANVMGCSWEVVLLLGEVVVVCCVRMLPKLFLQPSLMITNGEPSNCRPIKTSLCVSVTLSLRKAF